MAKIRVPDATPRSEANMFRVEFGYSGAHASARLAAGVVAAPVVAALSNVQPPLATHARKEDWKAGERVREAPLAAKECRSL